MTWNIAPEVISLVMLGIIIVYSRKGSHLPTLQNKLFQWCLVVTFCAMLSNIMSTLMIYSYETIPMWMTWIITSIYFVITPLMGMAYFCYTLVVIFSESPKLKKWITFCSIPGFGYAFLVLANPFTRNIFNLTMEQGYTRGSLISVTYIIFYVYCVGGIVAVIINFKRIEKKVGQILASFPLLAILVILFQEKYPQVILSGSAATCALLIIYLHLQNKQISLDNMTGIPNRQELLNMLSILLLRCPEKIFTLVVVSMRDFRQINNTCGQQNGDAFLKSISQFLCTEGPQQNVYRFSGDEFALLFTKEDETVIERCVRQILARMKHSWQVKDYRFKLNAVIGIVRHTDSTQTLDNVIASIEYAIYQAKTGKYGPACYCDEKMLEQLERKRQIISILKESIVNRDFEMFYQPIYEVSSGKFLYAESLMRMNNTPIGPIYPSEFIPIAEETGLLIKITYIILDKVCRFIRKLIDMQIPFECIHVNFSAIQFSELDLKEKILGIINRSGIPTNTIKIEFTESTLAENPETVKDFVLQLEPYGIIMGLDDFGTGYSNISSVISIPFGTIKLDRSLVWASMDNKTSALAIKSLTRTFKDLGMKVIAEGVETEEHRQLVVDFGVDQIQGFYYSKPLSEKDIILFLQDQAEKLETIYVEK